LLCYLINAIGIERDVPSNLLYGRKRLLVRPHRIDGLLSSSGNVVVTAVAFIRAVSCVIRPFQLGKINVLTWNVLNGRIRRFAERQGVAGIGYQPARNGHDNPSGIALDGNRMIWTWKFDLLCFHVLGFLFVLAPELVNQHSSSDSACAAFATEKHLFPYLALQLLV
jgi:hypothetical protein